MKHYAPKQPKREEEQPIRRSANAFGDLDNGFAPAQHLDKRIQAKHEALQRAIDAQNAQRIQPKLSIGSPNDKYEKDADSTAEKVMSTPKPEPTVTPRIINLGGLNHALADISKKEMLQMLFAPDQATFETLKKETIQRQGLVESDSAKKANDGSKNGVIQPSSAPAQRTDEEAKKAVQKMADNTVQGKAISRFTDLEATLRASYGGGHPMPDELRIEMETRFGGLDFSRVRIHVDSDAQRMCTALHARAFTSGRHIYFNTGEWDPASKAGKILLAHELTHTVHQGATTGQIQREVENDEAEVQMEESPDVQENVDVQKVDASEVQQKAEANVQMMSEKADPSFDGSTKGTGSDQNQASNVQAKTDSSEVEMEAEEGDVQMMADEPAVQMNRETIGVQREPSHEAKILEEIVKKKNKEKRKNRPGWVNTVQDLEAYMFRATTEQDNKVTVYKPIFATSPDQDRFILYSYLKKVYHAEDSVIWKTINQHKRPTNYVETYETIYDTPVDNHFVFITIPVSNKSFLRGLDKLYTDGRPDLKLLLVELELYLPRFTWLDQRNLAGLFQHMHRISPMEIRMYRAMSEMRLVEHFKGVTFNLFMVKASGQFHADLERFRANKIEYLKDSGWFEAYFTTDDPVKTTQLTSAVERINLIDPAAIKMLLKETSESDWKKHYKGDHPGDGAALKKLLKRFKQEVKFESLESIEIEEEETELDQLFKATGHTRNEPFDFVHLFQEQTMRLAFQMIKMNQDLLIEEYIHYSDQDKDDVAIKKLFRLLENEFVDPYHEGNEMRAIGLRKFFKTKYGNFLSGVDSADLAIKTIGASLLKALTNNSIPLVGMSFLSSTYPILRSLMGMSQENMAIALRNHSRYEVMAEVKSAIRVKEQLDHALSFTFHTIGIMSPESIIGLQFPELFTAEGMDNETDQSARGATMEEFPIMADLSIDPRDITFAAKSAKSYAEFRKFIHNLIDEKLENGNDLKSELKDNPEKVWELDGLITQTKEKYGIFEGSISDQIVNDVIGDIGDAQFWSDIFLGAVGIILGIAGIFTGGLTTVLGVGLLAAGAAVSIAELVIAKDRYDFTVMSTDTAIGVANELSHKEPNALGMILGMIGMGLDLIPFVKLLTKGGDLAATAVKMTETQTALTHSLAALEKFTNGGKVGANMTRVELQQYLLPLYEKLGTASTKGFAKNIDEFTDKLVELHSKQRKSVAKMDSMISKYFPEVADGMSDMEKVGWSKLWDADEELAERLFMSVKANPVLRTKIGTYALIDPNTATSIARLEKLLGGEGFMGITSSQMSRTLQHILSKGGDDWVQLPVLLTKLEGLGAPSTKFVETVLTQSRLTHLLNSGDYAATALYSSWNKYFYGGGNKLGQTFVDFAEGAVKKVGGGANLLDSYKTRLNSRVQSTSGLFVVKHTDDEIVKIIQKGQSLNLSDDVIDDLLFISSRNAKPINAGDLVTQMDNWVNEVSKRGYPYKFTDIRQFIRFKNELKTGLKDIGVSTSDVRIQGSALRTPNANDVDLAAIISETDFDNFLVRRFHKRMTKNGVKVDLINKTKQELNEIASDVLNNPNAYSGQGKSFSKAMLERKISAYSKDEIVPGAKKLYNQMKTNYPNLNIENISIQTPGGSFDLKPFIKL